MSAQNEAMAAEALNTERYVRQQHERTILELCAEIERLRAELKYQQSENHEMRRALR